MIDFTDEEEIEAAFEYYRKKGFPFPLLQKHEVIHIFRVLQKSTSKINKEKTGFFKLYTDITVQSVGDAMLASFFHPHIWESKAAGMRSPLQSWDIDKSLEKIFINCLKFSGKIDEKQVRTFARTVNGTQMCSNFRPTAAKAVYDYFSAENVLDMSTGYGGRLIGFLASKSEGVYIGIDPNKKTCAANKQIAKTFKSLKRVKIICQPFEDVSIEKLGIPDLAFTSPPYFSKEIYDEDSPTQSRERYVNYEAWRKNFLFVMIKKTYQVLPKKGILALNINDVKIKNKKYPLVKDSIEFAKHIGFVFDETLYMKFSGFGKGLKKTKHEPILIFVK